MSAQTGTTFLSVPAENLDQAARDAARANLQEYLLQQWKANAFRRVVEMDKIQLVNRGERPYFTRVFGEHGHYQEEPGLGAAVKGYARPGMWMKFTQHHPVAYISDVALYRGLHNAGYRLTDAHRKALTEDGQAYLTNGMDNRLIWVMPIDAKLKKMLLVAGHTQRSDLLHKDEPFQVGDYLRVFDREEKYTEGGLTGYRLRLDIHGIRSKAFAAERFRYLDALA
jgi:hypothetical protein